VEGVSRVLMCYDLPRDGRKRNTRMMATRNDHTCAALPPLSRHRYRPTWEDPSRQATLPLPREVLCGSYLPAGVCLYRSIGFPGSTSGQISHMCHIFLYSPGKPVSATASRVGNWRSRSTRGDATQRYQRAKKKKSELVIGVGRGTLGTRAALIALKKGAYLRRG